jgi:DHA2 family metal-tetracycline-proton antiporter-like MFS transporter
MEKQFDLRKAFQIGIMCVGTYLISYYMRNLLSVTTPGMLEAGAFTEEFIGTLSSVYFLVYAIGQLVNGRIGDVVKPKYMVCIGLFVCGACSVGYSYVTIDALRILFFGLMGFSLSMLRGPLVKTICENTKSEHSHLICVFLSFTSFVGPFIASFLAIFFDWERTFVVAGISCIIAALAVFVLFSIYEQRGIINYHAIRASLSLKKETKIYILEKSKFY